MKRKGLIITNAIFFLIVNTNYFWEDKLGLFAVPAFAILVIVYFMLLIVLLRQIIFTIKEKFAERQRLFVIVFLIFVLVSTYLFPRGIINFDTTDGKDIFVAEREGAANCTTIFKLKEDNKFVERRVCFEIIETKGNYKLIGDTLFFQDITLGRGEKDYYEFAVIKKLTSQNKSILGQLVRYKNYSDTTGNEIWIIKNDLYK